MSHRPPDITRWYFPGGAIPFGAMFLALLLSACASQTGPIHYLPPLNGQPEIYIADVELLEISPAMEAFLDQYVDPTERLEKKAWNLVWAVTDRNVLPFDYDPMLTANSVQTFAARAGNCLGFSSMLIALARHRGLNAWYQEVEIPPQWNSVKNTLLVSLHMNVVIEGKRENWVVDISGEAQATHSKIKRMSDTEALAQYYNNLGADALMNENLAEAYAYFTKALETMPTAPYLWSNLAVVFGRNEQFEDARLGYMNALQLDPDNAIAANNLFLIYQRDGNLPAAKKLQALVERHRRTNPYYLYYLSSVAIDEGRYQESSEMLQKAIVLNEKEFRFHYELARSLFLAGDREAAQASLDRALQLAPADSWADSPQIDNLPALPE